MNEIIKELETKFTKFAYWKDIKDLEEIKQDFFNAYHKDFGYYTVVFFDNADFKTLFL